MEEDEDEDFEEESDDDGTAALLAELERIKKERAEEQARKACAPRSGSSPCQPRSPSAASPRQPMPPADTRPGRLPPPPPSNAFFPLKLTRSSLNLQSPQGTISSLRTQFMKVLLDPFLQTSAALYLQGHTRQ
ncbi:Spliceosome-associated protein CWC15, partial [Manis javanica]